MKKTPRNKGKRVLAVILGIIWGILVVITAYDVVKIYTYTPYYYSSSGAEYTAKKVLSKDYGSIYSTVQNDISQDFEFEEYPAFNELKAIHDYIEAAAQYRMYNENGINDKAARYKERMDEAKTRLGKFAFTVQDMNEMLGIK
ncbi:MAG: hypothetical protein IKZ39_05780 [Lachnospiraceae bacterium]|nr:hypothetical protein [Lachnospiraceae bacterium]